LDLVNRVEHDHPFGNFRRVVHQLARLRVAAPDLKIALAIFVSLPFVAGVLPEPHLLQFVGRVTKETAVLMR